MSECHNILTFFFIPLFGIKYDKRETKHKEREHNEKIEY